MKKTPKPLELAESFEEDTLEPVELEEPTLDSPESPIEATTPAEKVKTHTCTESDSYASLSARFCPKGMTKHQYSLELVKKNGNKALRPGTSIIL
jgi:hypothetical protein